MKEFKHLPGLDLIRVFGILVVVFYHYQVETAVRGLCPADFLPAMEPLVQVAVFRAVTPVLWSVSSKGFALVIPSLFWSLPCTSLGYYLGDSPRSCQPPCNASLLGWRAVTFNSRQLRDFLFVGWIKQKHHKVPRRKGCHIIYA